MPYTNVATSKTPALILYLLDVSASMGDSLGSVTRMKVVNDCLVRVLRRMVKRSTKGESVAPRYKAAIIAYASQPTDVLQGIKTCADLAQTGMPQLQPTQSTNTAAAFQEAKRILEREIPTLPKGAPAPLVCHMTDGEFNDGGDPTALAKDIMAMKTEDGNVLVENIFIKSKLMQDPIGDAKKWIGCSDEGSLSDSYARKLFAMSSPLPDSYRSCMLEEGYSLQPGIRMLFPGESQELVELAFAVSGATPVHGPGGK